MPQPKFPRPPSPPPESPTRVVAPPSQTGQRVISKETSHRLMRYMLQQNKVADAGPRGIVVVVVVGILVAMMTSMVMAYCR